MILRLLILFLLTAKPLRGDIEQEVTNVVSELASGLSDRNPQLFLSMLDRSMPGYEQLDRDLNALAADTHIACTIEIIEANGPDTARTAVLDWYMVLSSRQDDNLIERRRTKVTIKLEKRGKKWLVTSFTPLSIFASMTVK
jgi:hypothetical protein